MFLLLPLMCVDLYFFFVCVVFYDQEVDIRTFFKDKMADRSPRGFVYPTPPSIRLIFYGRGHEIAPNTGTNATLKVVSKLVT